MKELKIEIPKNHEIDTENSTFERIVFKEIKKDVTERIKTFDDACREAGTTEKEFEKKYSILDAQGYASEQFKLLRNVVNENWQPNWDDSNEYKYFIWYDMRGKGSLDFVDYRYWDTYAPGSSCFKTEKLARFIESQFPDIIRTYFKG